MASKSVNIQITNELDSYCQEVLEAAKESAKEAAESTAKALQNSSPKREKGRGRGKYAKGWTVKKQGKGRLFSYVVYNKNNPALTHTLEHGHVASNQYGTWGRVRAIPHIGPAADAGVQRYQLGIRTRLNKR